MMLNIHFEATLLQRLVYPFFFIKSRKRELFFAFAAKINFSDTGTFSKIIFDHMQVFKKHIRTYITALMLIIFSKKQKFCVNLHATYKLLRFPKIVPQITPPSTTFPKKKQGGICRDIVEESQGHPLIKK